jgi:hypothetical protein
MKSLVTVALLSFAMLTACTKEFELEYAKPAAQFNATDIATKGKPYIGQKVTVKVEVVSMDYNASGPLVVHLNNNSIICSFGKLRTMGESIKVGDTVFIDGILVKCDAEVVHLSPAVLRDPTAPFSPR